MPVYVTINDKDLPTEYGLVVQEVEGWLSSPELQFPSVTVPDRLEPYLGEPVSGTRPPIRISGELEATSLTDRKTKLVKLERDLAGELEVVSAEDPGERTICVKRATVVTALRRGLEYAQFIVRVALLLEARRREDIEDLGVAFTTTAAQVPLGDQASGGLLYLTAPGANAVNPVVTYADATGQTKGTMGFTITLASNNDFLEVDLDLRTITKSVSGVRTVVNGILSSGGWFALSPEDGAPAGPVWPTLKVSSGAGQLVYRRRWQT